MSSYLLKSHPFNLDASNNTVTVTTKELIDPFSFVWLARMRSMGYGSGLRLLGRGVGGGEGGGMDVGWMWMWKVGVEGGSWKLGLLMRRLYIKEYQLFKTASGNPRHLPRS